MNVGKCFKLTRCDGACHTKTNFGLYEEPLTQMPGRKTTLQRTSNKRFSWYTYFIHSPSHTARKRLAHRDVKQQPLSVLDGPRKDHHTLAQLALCGLTWLPAVPQLKPLSRRPEWTPTPVAGFHLVAIVLSRCPVMCRHCAREQKAAGAGSPLSHGAHSPTAPEWSTGSDQRTQVGFPGCSLLVRRQGPEPTSPAWA